MNLKKQAINLRVDATGKHTDSLGAYYNYLINLKILKNSLFNQTIDELKSKLKSLGFSDEDELKKLHKKIDYVNKVIELL